jgi:nitric oxide reductase subunit B
MSLTGLKWAAILCFFVTLTVLIIGGVSTIHQLAPYPNKVETPDGRLLFTKQDILAGQDAFQSHGLMDQGMVWGHGTQRGPEFSAVSLHIISESVRNSIAQKDYGKPYGELDDLQKDLVGVKAVHEIRENRYDASKDLLTLTDAQVAGLKAVEQHWDETFKNGEKRYGFLPNTVTSAKQRLELGRFFFWTAWVASTKRPGTDYTYTNNWPADRSVGNVPTTETYLWTLGGLLSFLIVVGIFIFCVHHYGLWFGAAKGVPLGERLVDMPLTSSQRKAAKFFLVVILLFLGQTCVGGLLAHYTVHPASFYLQIVAEWIPYNWAKTWHLQLAIFWIMTTWIASAVYIAPIIGGAEPRHQGALVQLLFVAVLIVAAGSLLGEVAGIKNLLGDWWFWFGHQGWEYLELGRAWQILLYIGLIAWLFIVYRPIRHHLKLAHKDDFTSLILLYVVSAVLVVVFFGFGLLYGKGSHFTLADYWRWFVVHIWVESIFEFFGIAVIALLLVTLGLASARAALSVSYFTIALVFFSGILGTAHHFFWFGQPSFWLAIGSVFSSLEPVPLLGLVVRGLMEYREVRKEGEDFPYKWPLYFLAASSFWNFLGAGVFGFLNNLPLANYYEHGTYLTVNHAHGALFGVYGMLSIALLLFSWRGMVEKGQWNNRILKVSFWGFNGGLLLMMVGTLFPVGVLQVWTSFSQALWVARDASFFERPVVMTLTAFRVVPDLIVIILGVLPLLYFLFATYRHLKPVGIQEGESVWARLGVEL